MSEMYEFVQNSKNKRKGKRRVEWKIAVLIAVAVAILAVIGGLLWRNMTAGRRFSEFCGKLSESTTYAYEHDSAAVEDADGIYGLTTENLYELYQCVCVYGPGKERRSAPEGDGVTVTYGNGSSLKLVKVGEGKDEELFFCYSDADGYSHVFRGENVRLSYIVSRYLSRSKNEVKA
ncbi:MAG: hypothetical protein J5441_08075 [Clostridia bacterium]|nr:hypothetical protein [Clostridia bacterium]